MKPRPIGRVALCQALRYHFNLTYGQIAGIMHISKRSCWNHCNHEWGTVDWEDRVNQKDIIDVAKYELAQHKLLA